MHETSMYVTRLDPHKGRRCWESRGDTVDGGNRAGPSVPKVLVT